MQNEKLHNLYPLLNIIRLIKLRRVQLAGMVPCMGEMRNALKICVGIPEGRRSDGTSRIVMLTWILKNVL